MPRYEFSEGTSNKFWDITLSGKSLTTTFGKIGAAGQTQIKNLGSDADAKKAYDKLIAEKQNKGYKLVGKAKPAASKKTAAPAAAKTAKAAKAAPLAPSGTLDARNKDLESAIEKNPNDRDAYAVFADWLQEQGDPRGELISLQLANKDKQAKALLEKHKDYFFGPLYEHRVVYDEGYNNSRSHLRTPAQDKEWQKTHKDAFLWRNGYIHRCRLSHDSGSNDFKGKLVDVLEEVLDHPSGRYIVEFAFHSDGQADAGTNLQKIIDMLGKKAPASTRRLIFGDNVDQVSWHHVGKLGKLWKGVPGLKTLEIETGNFDVGAMDAPNLEKAVFITGGLSAACGKNIANAKLPKIKHLEIYYGTENYGGNCKVKDVRPLLDRTDLTKLEYLGLKNCEFADALAAAFADGAKVLKTVKTLDLSLGTMTDDGALALVKAKDALKHLEVLDLTRNFLTKKGTDAVKGLCKKVITAGQEEPDDWGDGELHYFVDITE
jgi:uncharacterized protein (TIGR02996 family)